MSADVFRFQIEPEVPIGEAELSLQLATFAAEGLFGAARVRLEFGYHLDASRRVIVVDATTEVGAAVVRIFGNLLLREFGDDGFTVEQVGCKSHPQPQETAA